VVRSDRPYRTAKSQIDGFLNARSFIPGKGPLDLARAETLQKPVVGETNFVCGQTGLGIITDSNIGGFFASHDDRWQELRDLQIGAFLQRQYSLAFHDELLMGQYPTSRLFSLSGDRLQDLWGWPPAPPHVSSFSRKCGPRRSTLGNSSSAFGLGVSCGSSTPIVTSG